MKKMFWRLLLLTMMLAGIICAAGCGGSDDKFVGTYVVEAELKKPVVKGACEEANPLRILEITKNGNSYLCAVKSVNYYCKFKYLNNDAVDNYLKNIKNAGPHRLGFTYKQALAVQQQQKEAVKNVVIPEADVVYSWIKSGDTDKMTGTKKDDNNLVIGNRDTLIYVEKSKSYFLSNAKLTKISDKELNTYKTNLQKLLKAAIDQNNQKVEKAVAQTKQDGVDRFSQLNQWKMIRSARPNVIVGNGDFKFIVVKKCEFVDAK